MTLPRVFVGRAQKQQVVRAPTAAAAPRSRRTTPPWVMWRYGAAPVMGVAVLGGAVVCVQGQNLKNKLAAARKRNILGYDLIDELDPWFGNNSPDYEGPMKILDMIGNSDGRVTIEDWKAAGLPEEHFHYFDTDGDKRMNEHECHSWHQQRKGARTMNISEVNNPPKGHMKPLGAWRDPLPSDHLVYTKPYPHPRDFWAKHMDGWLPAILKGAQSHMPAMGWTREVLAEKFGWVDAKLEPKVEARGNHSAYGDLEAAAPSHRINISEYLRVEEGKNMYVVSILPQAMAWEVAHPSVLLCGSRRKMVNRQTPPPYKLTKHEYPHEAKYDWMTHIFEANLWIASGYTRSQLHYDKEWNVNCLISGRKRWFFLNSFQYHEDIQWSRGKKFKPKDPLKNAWTDWIFLDPDKVDLIVQNKLRNMDYYELIQEPGDCIFIPFAMLHQVKKLDEATQVAASWMFLPETIYDGEACKDAPLEEDLPLAAMDTLYMYTGKGLIPQGYGDPLNFVRRVDSMLQKNKEKHLTLSTFTEAVTQGGSELRRLPDKDKRIRRMYRLITQYADAPTKGLRQDELSKVPLRVWTKPAAEGDDEGPLPCDHGQEYFPCNDTDFKTMTDYVEDSMAAQKRLVAEGKSTSPAPLLGAPTHRRSYYDIMHPKTKSRTEL